MFAIGIFRQEKIQRVAFQDLNPLPYNVSESQYRMSIEHTYTSSETITPPHTALIMSAVGAMSIVRG